MLLCALELDDDDSLVRGDELGVWLDLLASDNVAVPRPGTSVGDGAFCSGFHMPVR